MHFFFKIFLMLAFAQIFGLLIWWKRLDKAPRFRLTVLGLFIAGNLPWPFFYFAFNRPDPPSTWISSLVIRLFLTWQAGLFLWLFISGIMGILIFSYKFPLRAAKKFENKPPRLLPSGDEAESVRVNRREFLVKTTRKAVWGTTLGCAAWGFFQTEFGPRVVTRAIPIPGLPKSLDGLTIAHLSDMHIGLWTPPDEVPRIISITRDLNPDMVVITGDIIDHNPSFSQTLVRHLHDLNHVPLGIYAVIGNHDIYTGAQEVSDALGSGGVTMLRDAHHSFKDQGLPMGLIGVDDPGRKWFGAGGNIHLNQAMLNLPPELFSILLVHRPTGFEHAIERGIPLTLCGHTHGGQFGVPGGPNLADLAYKFTHGLYEQDGASLYVSAGTGSVGLPFRVGVPAEIAFLRLQADFGNAV